MLPGFEVWVGEAEEDLLKLGLLEEVGKEFHGVRAQTCNVLIESRFQILIS